MTKVIKKHVKTAILFFIDPDTKIYRRVVFCEPKEMKKFFMDNAEILLTRINEMSKMGNLEKIRSPKKFLDMIKKSRRPWEQENSSETADDMEMTLTYDVKKLK